MKLGIAYDHQKRANESQGYYEKSLYLKTFKTREEAFFFEQAILNQTEEFAHCPKVLRKIEWGLIQAHGKGKKNEDEKILLEAFVRGMNSNVSCRTTMVAEEQEA